VKWTEFQEFINKYQKYIALHLIKLVKHTSVFHYLFLYDTSWCTPKLSYQNYYRTNIIVPFRRCSEPSMWPDNWIWPLV